MAKLTKTMIESIQPGAREVFRWDETLPGFGIRVLPSGKRSFVLQYRNSERRSRRITLGRFGVLTAQQAREKAIQKLAQVSEGRDPAEERRGATYAPTLSTLAARYLTEHADEHKKPRSAKEDRRFLDKHILPALGTRKISGIARSDISRLHSSMSATPYQANRVLSLAAMLFRFAEEVGIRPENSNPCRGIRRFKESPRERFLSASEMETLGRVLREMEQDGKVPQNAIAGVRLLIFTGARRDEIRRLRWSEVDLERCELRLEDSKTGPKSIPLSAPAAQIIAGLERRSEWVLPAARGKGVVNLNVAWAKIRTKAGLEGTRIHDLRHHFASVGAGAGMSLWQIGKLLGHSSSQTTNRYAHAHRDPIHAASEQISSKIAAAMDGREPAEILGRVGS